MNKGNGRIGVNVNSWQSTIERVKSKNNNLNRRLKPYNKRNSFRDLVHYLKQLEEFNKLLDRYQEVTEANCKTIHEAGVRIQETDKEMSLTFKGF